jgi:hypothetical protein
MERTGWNEQLLTGCRAHHLPGDIELDFAFHYHHQFIDGMSVILPDLVGRVSPHVTAESSRLPVRSDRPDVDGPCHSMNVLLLPPCTQAHVESSSSVLGSSLSHRRIQGSRVPLNRSYDSRRLLPGRGTAGHLVDSCLVIPRPLSPSLPPRVPVHLQFAA